MAGTAEPRSSPPQTLAEAAVRSLRHEVGDLLQTVYATAALLQQRLPDGWDLERRILAEMRARAQSCRVLLDVAHDLLCPMTVVREQVDFADLLSPIIAAAAVQYPTLRIQPSMEKVFPILADAQKLDQVGRAVLTDACEGAADRVEVTLKGTADGKQVQWAVSRDGDSLARERLDEYFMLGSAGYQGPASLGMVLARRIVRLHGGRITVESRREGGLCIAVYLPACGPLGS